MPSITRSVGMYFVAPAMRANVVKRSVSWMMSPGIWPASIVLGHQAWATTRTPPSRKSPFPPRKIVSAMPTPGGGLWDIGPLSAMATTRVFSAMPSSSSLATSRLTKGSTLHCSTSWRRLRATEHFGSLGMNEPRFG